MATDVTEKEIQKAAFLCKYFLAKNGKPLNFQAKMPQTQPQTAADWLALE